MRVCLTSLMGRSGQVQPEDIIHYSRWKRSTNGDGRRTAITCRRRRCFVVCRLINGVSVQGYDASGAELVELCSVAGGGTRRATSYSSSSSEDADDRSINIRSVCLFSI